MISAAAAIEASVWILIVLPPTSSLLLRRLVFGRRGEHAAAVAERHASARRVVRAVTRAEALDDHHVADLHRVARDAPALQHAGRAGREAPVRHPPLVVLHV